MRERSIKSSEQIISRSSGQPYRSVLITGLLFFALTILLTVNVHAASTSLHVSARILPWLNLAATPSVSSYRVEAEDIQKGYIDLPNSLNIQLATNLGRNIELNLSSFGPERVLVNGTDILNIPVISSTTPVTRTVDLRIILPQGIEQGDYPLQLNVSAINI